MLIILFVSTSFFTGCVERDVTPQQPRHLGGNQYSMDDVNMSDFDGNFTESEMMMTEEGEENKMERIAFSEEEYYSLARLGKGTIKGKIYVTDLYGDPVFGTNTRLYLNPATSYSNQWYQESYLSGYKMQKADPRLFNYLKFTSSDKAGNFAFYGVPSGSYYLIGTVKCGVACGYESTKNIRIAKRVSVRGNQILEGDLSTIAE